MSAKWRRVKAWDAENLTGPLTPIRWVLTAFSSITLAVTLLTTVVLYGTLASVPVGLLALIPTKLVQLAIFLLVVVGPALALLWVTRRLISASGDSARSREMRFFASLISLTLGAALGYFLWTSFVHPAIRYEPPIPALDRAARGLRFFAPFVEEYKGTVLRQLPSWEMTEIEFYAWWPFKLVLVLFVINMIVATIRRIEFRFVNIGVLTVHTGIVLIALGSIFYERGKVEGDIRLVKNMPPKSVFYDAILPAIYVWKTGDQRWYVHPLRNLSRYNEARAGSPHAPDVAVHAQPRFSEMFPPSLEIDVVGVVPYGEVEPSWAPGGTALNPSLEVELHVDGADGQHLDWSTRLLGDMPGQKALGAAQLPGLAIEHVVNPHPRRINDLLTPFPEPASHALLIRIPGSDFEKVVTAQPGRRIPLNETGWTIDVDRFEAVGEGLALISKGYQGAQSSRAHLRLTAPDGRTFNRSVLHQYPELSQDFILDPEGGPPTRTAPDPAIDITYLDASQMYIWIFQDDPTSKQARIVERVPGGGVAQFEISEGDSIQGDIEAASMQFVFKEFWPRTTQRFDVRSVPEVEQDRNARGTFFFAFLDVELSYRAADNSIITKRHWLPFNQYLDQDYPYRRIQQVELPEIGTVSLAFGRLRHELPDLALALTDFEMIPYPGTEQPRDYVSTLDVYTVDPQTQQAQSTAHVTRLNRPFIYRQPAASSPLSKLMSIFVPNQFKFSQAGWDPEQQQYTVLGVGNNPGIYIIAVGAILIGLGIPWAFYIKPAILRYQKRKIERQIAQGTFERPKQNPSFQAPAPNRSNAHKPTEVAT